MQRIFTHLAILLVFSGVSYCLLGQGIFSGAHYIFGDGGDSRLFYWFFSWWNYIFTHPGNLFISPMVWAPEGYNLTQATSVIGGWFLTLPLQLFTSPLQAMNTLAIFTPGLAAWSMYLLCFELSKKLIPAFLSAWLFGFSSYMIAHSLGHLNLVASIFLLPLLVLLVIRLCKNKITSKKFLVCYSALFIFLFSISIEIAFSFTLFGFLALLLARKRFFKNIKNQAEPALCCQPFKKIIKLLFYAYVISFVFLSPYLYYFFFEKTLENIILGTQGNNLLELIIPNQLYLIKSSWTLAIAQKFKYQNLGEQNGYIGLPLLIAVTFYMRENWKTIIGKYLSVLLIITFIISLGGAIYFGPTKLFNNPILLGLHKLPLLSSLFLSRLALYGEFVISIMMVYWLSNADTHIASHSMTKTKVKKYLRYSLIVLAIVFLLPAINNKKYFPGYTLLETPEFFQSHTYQDYISHGDNVIIISSKSSQALYDQVVSGLDFNLSVAYFGRPPKYIPRYAYNAIVENQPEKITSVQLLNQVLVPRKVNTVLLEEQLYPAWHSLLSQVPAKVSHVAGMWVYQLKI